MGINKAVIPAPKLIWRTCTNEAQLHHIKIIIIAGHLRQLCASKATAQHPEAAPDVSWSRVNPDRIGREDSPPRHA
jgi:hypothetical protein